MAIRRFLVLFLALLGGTLHVLANGSITLTSPTSIAAADGLTTVTITAEVRDSTGRLVDDGTRVFFESNLGTFREEIVETRSGYANVVLEAGNIPGTAKIKASVPGIFAAGEYTVELVENAEMLSSATDYIEVVSPDYLLYGRFEFGSEKRILEASSVSEDVELRYRDIRLEARDLQLNVTNYEVKARQATLYINDNEWKFDDLNFKLDARRGLGNGEFPRVDTRLIRVSHLVRVEEMPEQMVYGFYRITPDELQPLNVRPGNNEFVFEDLSLAMSTVEGRKATVYPSREIHFNQASIKVQGQTVMSLPLFKMPIYGGTPVITDDFVNITGSQFAIDYPYYLSLKPGETSALRFRYGNRYNSGVGASGGTFLDYELNWNRGDEMNGGLTVSGIGRNDWGIGLRQYNKLSRRTTLNAQLNMPARETVFGNANFGHRFNDFDVNLTSNLTRSLRGPSYSSERYSLGIQTRPVEFDFAPVRATLSLRASNESVTSPSRTSRTERLGLRANFRSRNIMLDRKNSVLASYSIGQFAAKDRAPYFTHDAQVALNSRVGPANFLTTYEYTDDGFTSDFLGRHRLTTEARYAEGSFGFNAFVTKSLDAERLNASVGFDYRFSQDWRMDYQYYFDQYDAESYLDHTLILAYRVGYREVGLSYSHRTKRIGLEIFGARFN